MIRVGIAGADTRMAGELIRILINHPDVELVSACAADRKGIRIDRTHHGLAGECDLTFSEFLDPENLDVVFIDAHSKLANHFRNPHTEYGDLRIIDMSHGQLQAAEDSGFAYALAELNRKPLVRHARKAVVPRSVSAVALIMLQPLALHMMLNTDLHIDVDCPPDIAVPDKLEAAGKEVRHWLSKLQPSFNSGVHISFKPTEEESLRGVKVGVTLPAVAEPSLLAQMYETLYEDHNFSFLVNRPLEYRQVEGTDKCLIRVAPAEEGYLRIEAVADCRMRGGAGDAVHAMNLMFGLCETTGLHLKAIHY